MSLELVLLRALLRLSRRRSTFTSESASAKPFARVEADRMAIKRAFASLAKQGLVHRATNGEPRLTLAGFAVAAATTAILDEKAKIKPARVARVIPLVRRPAA